MSHKPFDSRHSIDSCTFQLHSWRPFHYPLPKTPDPDSPKPYTHFSNGVHSTKRPCLSDRATSSLIDTIDISKLSLIDDENNNYNNHHNINSSMPTSKPGSTAKQHYKRESLTLIARKRRRRASRSVSGRSSERSGNRRCCSAGASAAYGTCSDFPVAVATDSSGELFGNSGDANWLSDVSEARVSRDGGGSGEKESSGGGLGLFGGGLDAIGNESGYGSEPGYRGDAEFGYGDEFDEEEDDSRLLFWGNQFGDTDSKMEVVGENTFDQKSHHRCRRKKHDYRMVES